MEWIVTKQTICFASLLLNLYRQARKKLTES